MARKLVRRAHHTLRALGDEAAPTLTARTEISLGARAPHPDLAITGTPPDRKPLIDPPR
jgi:hypothetical protein